MEGSPTEQIKMEHQVPQSTQNTSIGSQHDSLSGALTGQTSVPPVGSVGNPVPNTVEPVSSVGVGIQSANHNTVMTSLSSPPNNPPYSGYYGQTTDFYSNPALQSLPGLTHLQTELEKKKRDSPGAYQSSTSSSIPSNFGGKNKNIFNNFWLQC